MKKLQLILGVAAVSAVLAGGSVWAQGANSKAKLSQTTASDWSVEVIAQGLDYPWEIEHSGDVLRFEQGRLSRQAVQTSDRIARQSGAGLLGMALSPDFNSNGVAYFYHTYEANGELANKVIEAKLTEGAWRETRVLLTGIPGHRLYNGGRVAVGPHGNLYVTTGWTDNRERPQDLSR